MAGWQEVRFAQRLELLARCRRPGLTRRQEYSLPNDGEEQDRQDLQHGMCLQIMDGRLADAPIDRKSTSHVLDIGTGTGIWAIEFAEQYPNTLVVGTDLRYVSRMVCCFQNPVLYPSSLTLD